MKRQLNVRIDEKYINYLLEIQEHCYFYPKKKKLNELIEIAISNLYNDYLNDC